MRKFIVVTLIMGIMLAFVIWTTFNFFTTTTIEIPAQTYAVVKEFKSRSSSGTFSVYEYTVDGKTYSFWGYNNYTLVIGDKFVLEHDDLDPEEKKIFYDRPIFLDNEATTTVTGKIKWVKKWSKKEVEFQYVVEGKVYTRMQALPDEYKKLYPNLAKGKEYQIEYWNQNPQRAIVYLDKPL